jgi:cephalosporin hydroxylase
MNYVEQGVVDTFTKLFYLSNPWNGSNMRWLGVPVFHAPSDLWVMQEIITETKPDLIIETGSAFGGSALFFASVFLGNVISIDTQQMVKPVVIHKRIEFKKASSLDKTTIAKVKKAAKGKRVMVFLDSDHHEKHVAAELKAYASLVTPGCYLVVHDTLLGGNPLQVDTGENPMAAVKKFMDGNEEFETDRTREKFLMTFSPSGFLRRRDDDR